MNSTPLVSIVIPFYDGLEFIEETLQAFINQTYCHWECLVIDDHSPVSAQEICMRFHDDRIKYLKNTGPSGMANARNFGCLKASGEFIALCDQDDISLPERLRKQVQYLQQMSEVVLLGTWRQNFGVNQQTMKYQTDPETIKIRLLGNSQFTNPSVMMRSKLFKDDQLRFDQEMAPSDDYDFICKAAQIGELTNVPEILFHYRLHDKQVSVTHSKTMDVKAFNIRKNYAKAVLQPWQSQGIDTEQMAEFFSHQYPDHISISDVKSIFTQWLQYNQKKPVWKQHKWQVFMAERFLMTLMHHRFGRWSKLKAMFYHKNMLWQFIKNHKVSYGLKFVIKGWLK